MINKTISVIILLSSILLLGCNNDELEKPNASWLDKLKSTEQIVDSNFNQRTTVLTGNIDSLQCFLEVLNKKKSDFDISKSDLNLLIDSLSKSLGLLNKIQPYEVLDKNYISKEKINNNNKLAFKALMESSWKDSINFNDFKEYISPYKLTNEIFDDWRDSLYINHQKLISLHPNLKNLDSLYNYHRKKTYNSIKSKISTKNHFLSSPNYSWLNISKEGKCGYMCKYAIYHLRASGVPATYDYIPEWGNRPRSGHAYVGLANRNKQLKYLLSNNNNPTKLINNLNATINTKYTHIFLESAIPKNLYVQYEKTIPKVYRETWSIQSSLINSISNVPLEEIYRPLIKPNMVDVTSQYLQVGNVEISKSYFDNLNMMYLATFDRTGWIPIAYSSFNLFGKAIFKDLGKNVMYLPMSYKNRLKPFSSPFLINSSGVKKTLICNKNKLVNMKLIRKYPLFSYTANHAVGFKGCRIEGSNDSKFKDAKILHEINYYPFSMQQIDFKKPDTLRYIRLVTPRDDSTILRLAEIECYQDSCGVNIKLVHKTYKNGRHEKKFSKVLDGKLDTYASGRWFKLDFEFPRPISRIRFCPKNDTNCIIPGNEYELFYWDNSWVSAGKKIAKYFSLDYKAIPSGTIYWLKCLTEGKEERIFTYDDGRQIWW